MPAVGGLDPIDTNESAEMVMRFASLLGSVFVVLTFSAMVGARPAWAQDDAEDGAEGNRTTWVTSIASLGRSGRFVAATADGLLLREASVVSFDVTNPSELTPLYQHPAAVWQVVVVGEGKQVASVDYKGNLVVYDVETEKATTHEGAFERWCQTLAVSPDGESLIAGNEAGKVMVWSLSESKVTASAELDEHAVTGLAVSPDGKRVAASDGGGHVHLLEWPGLKAAGQINVGEETAWCVAFVDDGKSLLVGSADRQLYRCEAKPEAEPKSMIKGGDWITQIAVSPSGEVAVAEIGGRIRFPGADDGSNPLEAESGAWSLAWHGSGQLLVGTRKDGIASAGRSWTWLSGEASDDDDQ